MSKKYFQGGRTEQKMQTRHRILQGAQSLLAKGVDFTLEDVAKEVDISRATIYRYFSNIDVLAAEAGLDFNTKSSEEINEKIQDLELTEAILAIQKYYNDLAKEQEAGFRKFLSATLALPENQKTRGGRRVNTLNLLFEERGVNISKKDRENIINIATVLMGIEPLISSKDVCGLNNEKSGELLKWGLDHILKSVFNKE
ncbi:TetR/AcrR family transcriptional regulator [Christiangramia aquimixticola]|uniref:TetR/AcrR family transcriptional regulator n=1 Tax=Christiangramia aquimixticola TaxID=1697558 RepID=UPI003AA9932B